jgi:hypothetical protein
MKRSPTTSESTGIKVSIPVGLMDIWSLSHYLPADTVVALSGGKVVASLVGSPDKLGRHSSHLQLPPFSSGTNLGSVATL